MGLGSCYKAALVQTIHCKVQFMQMARTDGTKYLDNEGLQDKMMIEICSLFQFPASDVASAGCRAVHKEGQRRPHLREHWQPRGWTRRAHAGQYQEDIIFTQVRRYPVTSLFQVMVCGNKIGWRQESRRVVVYTTDQVNININDNGRYQIINLTEITPLLKSIKSWLVPRWSLHRMGNTLFEQMLTSTWVLCHHGQNWHFL